MTKDETSPSKDLRLTSMRWVPILKKRHFWGSGRLDLNKAFRLPLGVTSNTVQSGLWAILFS